MAATPFRVGGWFGGVTQCSSWLARLGCMNLSASGIWEGDRSKENGSAVAAGFREMDLIRKGVFNAGSGHGPALVWVCAGGGGVT